MPETQQETDMQHLKLHATIGFGGRVAGGLLVHPKRQHIIYPLGCTVIVEDIGSHKQTFLCGHTNDVTCVAVSKNGNYIASGQTTHMGFKADIIVWDFAKCEMYCKFSLHKVKVEALTFSPNELFLLSLGGQDDGSVVVWNLARKEAICGQEAQTKSAGTTYCIAYANKSDYMFVTGGDGTLRVWDLDVENRKITAGKVVMGQVKRTVKCIQMSDNDDFFYCGTTSGDILGVNAVTKLFQKSGPIDGKRFSLGVTAMQLLKNGDLVVGSGSGDVCIVSSCEHGYSRTKKAQKVNGMVTSIALRGDGHQFFVGTDMSHVYRFNFADFNMSLINTCHYSAVNDVAFPSGCSELFGTCSENDVRIWHTPSGKELSRIVVPNMVCNGLEFTTDGTIILTAWNDGRIRAFYPESGKPMFVINDAHNLGVTALACTSDGGIPKFNKEKKIISGGGDGQVRVWNIQQSDTAKGKTWTYKLIEAMKEHKALVSYIRLRKNDKECVTASTDGTCIIWNLVKFKRSQVIFSNTLFKCVCYDANECQIITSGTDRKIAYWETTDGQQIRELEGSKSGSVNGMDVSVAGNQFVTGGDDKLLKVWLYNEGIVTHVGIGHSGSISRVKICPNDNYIISVSNDGAILIWDFPKL